MSRTGKLANNFSANGLSVMSLAPKRTSFKPHDFDSWGFQNGAVPDEADGTRYMNRFLHWKFRCGGERESKEEGRERDDAQDRGGRWEEGGRWPGKLGKLGRIGVRNGLDWLAEKWEMAK